MKSFPAIALGFALLVGTGTGILRGVAVAENAAAPSASHQYVVRVSGMT